MVSILTESANPQATPRRKPGQTRCVIFGAPEDIRHDHRHRGDRHVQRNQVCVEEKPRHGEERNDGCDPRQGVDFLRHHEVKQRGHHAHQQDIPEAMRRQVVGEAARDGPDQAGIDSHQRRMLVDHFPRIGNRIGAHRAGGVGDQLTKPSRVGIRGGDVDGFIPRDPDSAGGQEEDDDREQSDGGGNFIRTTGGGTHVLSSKSEGIFLSEVFGVQGGRGMGVIIIDLFFGKIPLILTLRIPGEVCRLSFEGPLGPCGEGSATMRRLTL